MVHNANCGSTVDNPIQAYEVTTYEDFRRRSVVGDDLEGHEMWQYANMNEYGYATKRLSGKISKQNLVIALPRKVHLEINKAQRMIKARKQLPFENVISNADILYNHVDVPNSKVDEMLAKTKAYVNNVTGG